MAPTEKEKIVTAIEMRRIEELAYTEGASELEFMNNAGIAIAEILEDFVDFHHLKKYVTLLVGKGNNGGDAYAAGIRLLELGFFVSAYHIFPIESCSELCKKQHDRFKKMGGTVHIKQKGKDFEWQEESLILDGLVGTGFKGKAEGELFQAIVSANHSGLPIIAIDIPSGLNGSTGEIGSVAIVAAMTVYLGLPKLGFFLGEGWNYVGELIKADFGLGEEYIAGAKGAGYLLQENVLSELLPPLKRNRHKYEAGYVLALAGSKGLSGAAALSSFATLRSGSGIVRLFHSKEMSLSGVAPEIVKQEWTLKTKQEILTEAKKANAIFIGPGLGRTKPVEKLLSHLLPRLSLPTVLDADALYFLAKYPKTKLPEETILTPHRGEMERLLGKKDLDDKELFRLAHLFAKEKKVTLVLKGAPTFIFHKEQLPIVIARGDPGMATAGSGDVLTGILASLVAQKMEAKYAALLGVYLHSLSGEKAAAKRTSYSVVASDLILHLSDAFMEVMSL